MKYIEQKKLAKSIFEKLGLNVDLSGCFDTIIPQLTIEQCIQVLNLVDDKEIKSEWAYNIGKYKPENRNDVIDFVTDRQYAYWWTTDIGDREIMINRITDSRYAYYWAIDFGDREIMIERITDPEYAFYWAKDIGDVDIMLPKFANTDFVFEYIKNTKSRKNIKELLTNPDIIKKWVEKFGGKKYFFSKFPELNFA